METKAAIRKRILKRRQELSVEEQNRRSRSIQEQVLTNPYFLQADAVFLYMDYKAEVQTGMLLAYCLKAGKKVALPRIDGEDMEFYEIRTMEDVRPGYFGILEPVTSKRWERAEGFMAVPGVAFTRDGFRMGYGKGFYDRYLQKYPGIYTCGLAYECQMLEMLPVEPHDKKLNQVITG